LTSVRASFGGQRQIRWQLALLRVQRTPGGGGLAEASCATGSYSVLVCGGLLWQARRPSASRLVVSWATSVASCVAGSCDEFECGRPLRRVRVQWAPVARSVVVCLASRRWDRRRPRPSGDLMCSGLGGDAVLVGRPRVRRASRWARRRPRARRAPTVGLALVRDEFQAGSCSTEASYLSGGLGIA
jgi:hypothetical protein